MAILLAEVSGEVCLRYLLAGVCAAACLGGPGAWAQAIPGSAQPGRVQEQIPAAPARPRVDVEMPAQAPAQAAPEGAGQVMFILKSLTVEEMEVYTQEEVRPYYEGLLGREVSLADLYAVAARLTQRYRDDGYLLSQVIVPAQDVTGGDVRLVAVEGFVDQVYIQPGEGVEELKDSARLRQMAERIRGMKPVTVAALERNLLLMGDLPGLEVKGVLKASPGVRKAADLYVLVSRKRVEGQVTVNNRGSRYLGPGQGLASFTYNGVFDENDALSVRGAASYQAHEMKYGELGYERVLTPGGLRFEGRGALAVTHPGAALEPFEVMGRDVDVAAGLRYPLVRGRRANVEAHGQFNWNDVTTKILGTPISKDRIRALRGGITASNLDSRGGANTARLEVGQGLDAFNASGRGDPVSRPRANPTFTKLNALVSREQGFRDSNFSVFGAATGQYSGSALLAPEEFGLGGEVFGSAYDPSEVTGDSGAALRLEGRYNTYGRGGWMRVAQPYVFYDVGVVHNRDAGVGVKETQTLASYGGGVRLYADRGWQAGLEVADPISRAVTADGNRESPRVFFRVQKAF